MTLRNVAVSNSIPNSLDSHKQPSSITTGDSSRKTVAVRPNPESKHDAVFDSLRPLSPLQSEVCEHRAKYNLPRL